MCTNVSAVTSEAGFAICKSVFRRTHYHRRYATHHLHPAVTCLVLDLFWPIFVGDLFHCSLIASGPTAMR